MNLAPELVIQTGALGILAFAMLRQSNFISKMHDTLTKLTLILGKLEERTRE